MNEKDIGKINEEIIRYYHELKPCLRSIKNLILATPELDSKDVEILNKAKEYQPLDEIVAEFKSLKKWKAKQLAENSIYVNTDKILLINTEFIEFIRSYRNDLDDKIISQLNENTPSELMIEAYTKYNNIIRELIDVNHKILRATNDIYVSSDKKNQQYLEQKHTENMQAIKTLKEQLSENSTKEILFEDSYHKILEDTHKEMNMLIIDLNIDDSKE